MKIWYLNSFVHGKMVRVKLHFKAKNNKNEYFHVGVKY